MINEGRLVLVVEVAAPPEQVWAAITDWSAQSDWMLGTTVRATTVGEEGAPGRGVGGGIEAWTGLGRFGFLDSMVVTAWDPPRRCVVRHTGAVVRGWGYFVVRPVAGHPQRSRFLWAEQLNLPLGRVGRVGWHLVRPAFTVGVRASLHAFARSLERARADDGLTASMTRGR